MKKLFLSLLLLPALAFLPACSDDDDLPEVNMEVKISGGTQSADDNKIYVEQGTPLVVESVEAVPTNGKKTTLGLTTYYLNGIMQLQTVTVPFAATFDTAELEPGEYVFQIRTTVYQVDKSAAFILLTYNLVVEAADDDATDTPGISTIKADDTQIAEQ